MRQKKDEKKRGKKRAALKRAGKHSGGTAELKEERERMAVPLPPFICALSAQREGLNAPRSWLPHRAKRMTVSAKKRRKGRMAMLGLKMVSNGLAFFFFLATDLQ